MQGARLRQRRARLRQRRGASEAEEGDSDVVEGALMRSRASLTLRRAPMM